MVIELDAQTIITAGAVAGALVTLITLLVKVIRWVDRQKRQDKEIEAMQGELTLLTYGILACLKGLKEQGCNGPVTHAIDKIEKHLNNQAHHQEEK